MACEARHEAVCEVDAGDLEDPKATDKAGATRGDTEVAATATRADMDTVTIMAIGRDGATTVMITPTTVPVVAVIGVESSEAEAVATASQGIRRTKESRKPLDTLCPFPTFNYYRLVV